MFGCGQTDSTDEMFDLGMSSEDYDYIKNIIQSDVVNWPSRRNDTLDMLAWKMMPVFDTVIPIIIKTDTGQFEIDIVDEFKRRTMGGFAGSYPFVECWTLAVPEKRLIDVLTTMKQENSSLQVPGEENLAIGRRSYWYYIDLYDKENNEIISTWTRPESDSTTSLCLVSYRQFIPNRDQGIERRLINKDFWRIENDAKIQRFEALVVDVIKKKIK